MSHTTYRRLFGVVLGALAGLAYMLVSQTINHIILPAGIPLYQPPFGQVGNILTGTLVGALLGLITAWTDAGALGVLISSVVGSLILVVYNFSTAQHNDVSIFTRITGALIILAPAAAFFAPTLMVLRWVVGREEITFREVRAGYPTHPLVRALLPSLVVAVAALTGLTSMYNDLGQAVMPRMQVYLQQAQTASSTDALPPFFRPPNVTMLLEKGRGPYQLEWDKDDSNKFAIPRPATSQFDQSTVIAHFDNGYLLACVFPSKTMPPECRDF